MKCLHTKDKLFNWKAAPNPHNAGVTRFAPSSSSSSAVSALRAETSTPPSSPSSSRSRSPRSRRQSRSPPRTPRARAPRVQSLSPSRDTPPAGSPRDSRRDTPTRNTRLLQRRLQYVCRNTGCGRIFHTFRDRNDHETSSCRNTPQSQVRLIIFERSMTDKTRHIFSQHTNRLFKFVNDD